MQEIGSTVTIWLLGLFWLSLAFGRPAPRGWRRWVAPVFLAFGLALLIARTFAGYEIHVPIGRDFHFALLIAGGPLMVVGGVVHLRISRREVRHEVQDERAA